MLVLAGSPLVNSSSKPLVHQASQTAEELPPGRGEGKVDQDHVDQLDRNLSTDDLLHEELRRYYPVPKNLEEVEEQALTFHVVSNMVFDLCISQDYVRIHKISFLQGETSPGETLVCVQGQVGERGK